MIAVSGIEEEHIPVVVAGVRSTHDGRNILVAVIVDIPERDSVAFLQMTESAGGGNVLKELAAGVAKHEVGNQQRQIRRPGGDVKVRKSVVIEVTKVASHGQKEPVELCLGRRVGERSIAVVAVEPRRLAGIRVAEVIGGYVADQVL